MAEEPKHPVSTTEKAMKTKATRVNDAGILAVQRRQDINMTWERTQSYIAKMVITMVMIVCSVVVILPPFPFELRIAALVFLTGNAGLVTGFYFGRTNHTRPTGEEKWKE